nr:hypothetical protein [uncultured Mediterranean phage uvMED]
MSLSKVFTYLKNKTEKPKKVVTHATLKIEEKEVYLYTDGTPCVIDIHYKGSIAVYSNDINFKISYIRNKIRIVNLFGRATKELLFTFDGNVDFIDSEISGYNGEIVKPNIEKNNKQIILDQQKTNLEDDTLILFPEYEEKTIKPFKAGYTRPKLSSNIVGSTGKFQQPTKVDAKQLSSIIQTYAEARVSSKQLVKLTKKKNNKLFGHSTTCGPGKVMNHNGMCVDMTIPTVIKDDNKKIKKESGSY